MRKRKKPGEQVFWNQSWWWKFTDLTKKKKKKSTANYISSSIVESEILEFMLYEWVWNNENFLSGRIATLTLMIFFVFVVTSFNSRWARISLSIECLRCMLDSAFVNYLTMNCNVKGMDLELIRLGIWIPALSLQSLDKLFNLSETHFHP